MENYNVYSSLIKLKIHDTSKQNLVINKLVNDTLELSNLNKIVNAIRAESSKDFTLFDPLTFSEYNNKSIDTVTRLLILKFYPVMLQGGSLTNLFLPDTKTMLIKKIPTARNEKDFLKHSKKRWEKFYRKYPQAGMIFLFSNVYLSEDNRTAIFIYIYSGRKSMGEEALAIMEKINGAWKIKYELNLEPQDL